MTLPKRLNILMADDGSQHSQSAVELLRTRQPQSSVAATEIIEYVKSNKIDLIVAGSRGLSEFKGWWMGSVSRKLVHYSNCSVLIVKGPKKE